MPNIYKEYRGRLNFTRQDELKRFFKGTDIIEVNWSKIDKYNLRLYDIFSRINEIIAQRYRHSAEEMSNFCADLLDTYSLLKDTNIIAARFTNNGRSQEEVYFNWMRGYLVAQFFIGTIADIFEVNIADIEPSGADNIQELRRTNNPDVFKKDAIADLKIESKRIHIEVQSGFTGTNDIKRSKALDAKRRYANEQWSTYIVHFDLFNGCIAVVDITALENTLPEDKWIQNAQFEGVSTTPIPIDNFLWNITEDRGLNSEIITELS